PHGEVAFLRRGEGGAGALPWIADDGPAPLAEKQTAAVLGGEVRFEVADATGRRAQPQVGQRRQCLVGGLLVEVRIAGGGAEEGVADANLIIAAVVLVVADESVHLVVEGDVVDVSQTGGEDVQVAAIGSAAKDTPSFEDEAVPLRPGHVTAAIPEGEV